MPSTRRKFFAQSATASAAVLAATGTSSAADKTDALQLKDGATILLQGDSITDAGRDKKNPEPNNVKALGRGYAQLIGFHLLQSIPGKTSRSTTAASPETKSPTSTDVGTATVSTSSPTSSPS